MSAHFTPTPEEFALVNQIFAQANSKQIGILPGNIAVKVFGGAKLTPTVLGEIWGIADEDNNGFLTHKGVAVAVRLMGWAQKGEKVSKALLTKSGPLASIEGVHAPPVPQGTGMSIPKSPPPGLPLLTPQDKAKFMRLFQGCGPVSGLLSGEKARGVFVKSKLPVDKLSQIWSLADTQDRGALDLTDFTLAMYLIQASMSGQLSFIPATLPPGLYEQAGGAAVVAHATGSSSAHIASPAAASFPPAPGKQPPVQTNFTGQLNLGPAHPPRRAAPAIQTPAAAPFSNVSPHWDVTPVEKASADRFFDTLDSHKRGYIEGDVAVPFMLQSKLPEDVLAQVWDLADINNDGRLTRDGFAIAMHLIQGKISGKDIPATLPPTLIPPTMRTNGFASPFSATSPPQPTDTIRDLLWDDSPPTSTVNPQPQQNVLQLQTTGMALSAFSPPPPARAPQALEDPFGAPRNSFHKDLLGDDDDTHTPALLHDQSAEIGNLQNQVNSTTKSHQNAKAEREAMEATLANQAAQLSALQTQLASAKASFETETSLLNTLKERHANQTAEMQKVREELIRSESDLSAIRVEKAEIEGAFLRDKEDVRELNRRMGEATTQITAAKQEVEKAKRDAKQQKGLLAIARKQLASKESEKAKVDQELQGAQQDLLNVVKEREDAEAEAAFSRAQPPPEPARAKSPADSLSFAAAQPLPVTPDITGGSPLGPGAKSNNPFERLTMGTSTPRSQSPFRSFSTTSLPLPPGLPPPPGLSPPDAVATTIDDPFGISQVFDAELQGLSEITPDVGVSTPKVKATLGEGDIVASPTEELFSTPLNSFTPVNQGGEATPQFPSLDSAAAHFPALEDVPGNQKEGGTDLSTDLRELDMDESDSDEESDEEEERQAGTSQAQARVAEVTPNTQDASTLSQSPTSFDDIFGASNEPTSVALPTPVAPHADKVQPAQNGSAAVLDAFGMPLTKPAAPEDVHDSGFTIVHTPVNATTGSSGISSFDEAFGKSSSSGAGQTSSSLGFESTFESAFEDNFDFNTSWPTVPPATSSAAPVANGQTTPAGLEAFAPPNDFAVPVNGAAPKAPHAQAPPVPFDNTFALIPPSLQTNVPQPERPEGNQSALGSISFEEAFGGVESSQALKLENSFSSRASNAVTNPVVDVSKQFPAVSPPTSPRGAPPRVNASIRSGSPQRATSPPPRVASPKGQRTSTSSSSTKDVAHEKPPAQPRQSKLSQLRLPFGRKKKQDTLPPVPARPEVVQPSIGTPAPDDDVEPVKQLMSMGFSRNQAVSALEVYDYDVPRALNSLLGAQ